MSKCPDLDFNTNFRTTNTVSLFNTGATGSYTNANGTWSLDQVAVIENQFLNNIVTKLDSNELIDAVAEFGDKEFYGSVNNLNNAFVVGDITLDIFMKTTLKKPKFEDTNFLSEDYFVATIHRQENIYNKEKLENIIKSLKSIERVIIPMHHSLEQQLNYFNLFNGLGDNIIKTDPLVYSEMLYLVKNSKGVVTDSGGLQKDAFWLEKPTITIRPKTEWVETLKNEQNILIDEFPTNIYEKISNINYVKFNRYNDFGNGNAVLNILNKTDEILS